MTAQPVKKFRAGQVACALWENEIVVQGSTKKVLKASVERRYTDKSGTWKSSGSFSRNEIPLAIYCLQKAFAAISYEENTKADDAVPVETVE